MTQNSGFWTTDATGDGGAGGYTVSDLTTLYRALFDTDPATNGPLRGYLNDLAVSGASSPVSIATGGAIVYGFWYINDAVVSLAIPTPVTSTRVDRVVLEADWTAQTVRIARVAGTEGAGAPSLTQNAGVKWQVPLAQASITTGGVITLTDQRTFATLNALAQYFKDGSIAVAALANDAVETAKIKAANVTYAKIQNVSATDKVLGRYTAGAGVVEEIAMTAAGRALVDDTDAAAQRTTLGLGTAAVFNVPAAGNAASGEVVKGSDTRLSDARSVVADQVLFPCTGANIASYIVTNGYVSTDASPHSYVIFTPGGTFAGTFDILVIGRNLGATIAASYRFVGGIKVAGGVYSLINTPIKTIIGEDEAGLDCDVSVTSSYLQLTFTGKAATTFYWSMQMSIAISN